MANPFYFVVPVTGVTISLSSLVLAIDFRLSTAHRLVELAVLAVSILALFVGVRVRGWHCGAWSRSTIAACILFLFWGAWVSVDAEYPMQSFQDLGLYAGMALVAFLIGGQRCEVARMAKWAYLLLIPGLIYSIIFVFHYMELLFIKESFQQISLPYFSNIRQFNNLQAILIPLYCFIVSQEQNQPEFRTLRPLAFVVLQIWLLILLYTGARAVLVSFAVVIATFLIVQPSIWRDHKKSISIFLAVLCVSYILFFFVIPLAVSLDVKANMARAGSSGRAELWLFSLTLLSECAWGCGGQSFQAFSTQNFPFAFGSPHNSLLSFYIEYGVLGLAIITYLGMRALRRARSVIRNCSALTLALSAALISFTVNSLFSGTQYTAVVGMLLPVFVGWFAAETSGGGSSKDEGRHISVERGLSVLFSSLCIGLFVITLLVTRIDVTYYKELLDKGGFAYPRFYEVGNFLY